MLAAACNGTLEQVSEKLDGMNVVFTYDGTVRIARSGGDIAGGGMDREALGQKFAGRDVVLEAFIASYDAIDTIVRSMRRSDRTRVFRGGTRWYSAEIVYAGNENVVPYEVSAIAVHETPVFDVHDGSVERSASSATAGLLQAYAERADLGAGWHVGPLTMRVAALAGGGVARTAAQKLRIIRQRFKLNGSATLRDLVRAASLDRYGDDALGVALASRIAGDDGAPSLIDIKRAFPGKRLPSTLDIERFLQETMAPVKDVIRNVAASVLSGIESALSSSRERSTAALQRKLDAAVASIRAGGGPAEVTALGAELARLPGGAVSAAVEGIVFIMDGRAYKLTGGFSPVQRILSLAARLQRRAGNLKEATQRSSSHLMPSLTRSTVQAVLNSVFKTLDELGATGMAPIGSTGKRELSGDIDIVARFEGGPDELAQQLRKVYGSSAVKRNGSRIVTIEHPHGDGIIPVDIMVGDPNLISWTRFGPSDDPSSDEHSGVKGMVRNLLLNAVTLVQSGAMERGGVRQRMTLDFDAGLKRVTQQRSGARWKTVSSELLADDPDEIVRVLFGRGFTARSMRTFEAVVNAIRRSPETRGNATLIFDEFRKQLEQYATTTGSALGRDPAATMDYIRSVIAG